MHLLKHPDLAAIVISWLTFFVGLDIVHLCRYFVMQIEGGAQPLKPPQKPQTFKISAVMFPSA